VSRHRDVLVACGRCYKRRKRKEAAALRAALKVELRAAEIASAMFAFDGARFSRQESEGWWMHHHAMRGVDPSSPAELAGWLAREIWSGS
jgi:hypothetical protein